MNPFEVLGVSLRKHRSQMKGLHWDLQQWLVNEGAHEWLQRDTAGWKREELVELSEFVFSHLRCPDEVLIPLNPTSLWRMESGIPVNRKALSTYCYLLGVTWSFSLRPVEKQSNPQPNQQPLANKPALKNN